MTEQRSIGVTLLVGLVRAYQRLISPLLMPRCRFYPSCSAYAVSALTTHGLRAGSWLALRRLLRCQPFASGGVDLVPEPADPGARPKASTASPGASSC